jgi:N-acetyl-anhydromuramyl-L-alanine amidase AmpD
MSDNIHAKINQSSFTRRRKKITLYPCARIFGQVYSKNNELIPKGITVHYTAGGRATSSIAHLESVGLGYHLLIDRDGTVWQMYYLDSTCSHAGKASWKGFSPNLSHISIALCSYGLLTPSASIKDSFLNEYGYEVAQVSYRQNQYWEPATQEQEEALFDICLWLCRSFDINTDNICGHSEACLPRGRKLDPGGVLDYPMSYFRKVMKNLYNQV